MATVVVMRKRLVKKEKFRGIVLPIKYGTVFVSVRVRTAQVNFFSHMFVL